MKEQTNTNDSLARYRTDYGDPGVMHRDDKGEWVRFADVVARQGSNTSEEHGAGGLTDEQIEQAVNAGPAAVRELIARAAIAAHLARQPKAEQPAGWVSVSDSLPKGECLAVYVTPNGKQRLIRAKYARQFEIEAEGDDCETEYNDDDDTFYIKAGWLECIDNWGEYSSCYVTEGEVTHWMRRPALPGEVAEVAPAGAQNALPVAWMRDNLRECKTDADVKHMASLDYGLWKEIAARYTIPLYFAATESTGAQNAEAIRSQAFSEAIAACESVRESSGVLIDADSDLCIAAIRALQSGTATTKNGEAE